MLEKSGWKHKNNEKRESYTKTQIKLLKIKNTVSEMKNSLDGINSRLDAKEKKTGRFWDVAIDTIQNKTKKKECKIKKRTSAICGHQVAKHE